MAGAPVLGGVFIGRETAQATVEFVVVVWVSVAVWTAGAGLAGLWAAGPRPGRPFGTIESHR
jgi:hypothetical protein